MDEDELQQIWDEGEARKKSALLFSTGSKVRAMCISLSELFI